MLGLFEKKPKNNKVNPDLIGTSQATDAKQVFAQGMVSVKDIIAPPAIEVDFSFIKIGNTFFRTIFVAGYPRFVGANWLSPLINFDHTLEISLFHYPIEARDVLDDLKRKVGEMEATINSDAQRGRIVDPMVQVALDDALTLQSQLVKGAERFFQLGLYITIPADTQEELETITKQVVSTLGSLLIIAKPATLQMEQGFQTTTPAGIDKLFITRNMDTTSLATTFPFTSSELTANQGIMYGINEHNGSLIIFDRFTLENANSVIFAKSGSGKSMDYGTQTLIEVAGKIQMAQIGPLIEDLITQQGAKQIEQGIQGVIDPNLKVWTFDKNLKGQWSNVTVAAKKKFSPRNRLYTITTKSGRQVTVTADHNLVILRKGKIRAMRSEAIKVGESIPLTRKINSPDTFTKNIIPKIMVPKWPENLPQTLQLDKSILILLGLATSEGLVREKHLRIFNTDPQVNLITEKCAKAIGARTSILKSRSKDVGRAIRPIWFANLFNLLGAGGPSGEKRVPPILFSLSNQQIAYYLRAYFEGDGGVEQHEVNATTKSSQLASDLSYLLLRFSIIARIRPRLKYATNTVKKEKKTYYQITISGKDNLLKFAEQIGFLTESKNFKLQALLQKSTVSNTNIDVVPTLQPIFNYLYKALFSSGKIPSPVNLSPLKRGVFEPSREELNKFIEACEKRLQELSSLNNHISLLRKLPTLATLIRRGSTNRKLNGKLWQTLGQSWRIMKNYIHPPLATNALLAYQTISGNVVNLAQLNTALYDSFKYQGVSLVDYNQSLWSSIVDRKTGNSSFNTISEAAKFITKHYRSTQSKIYRARQNLSQLKLLANSDLFWDPIVKIERIKHQEKYVYDLQVDNGVFLAGFGGMFVHNSYLVKLEALRSLMFGTEIIVIDPEEEYRTLAEAIGGEYINFSLNAGSKLNPFDLSGVYEEGENELGLKILSLHSLFRVVMGSLTPTEDALLDRALIATYRAKGITPDPQTQRNEPPLMEDLYKTLLGMEDTTAKGLADRIEKFIKGSLRGILDQHSNINIRNTFTVFSIRDLEQELRPIAMFMILDYVWTKIKKDLKKRMLIVDEAWYMMQYPDSATFLYSIAKRARKYYLGLTTITQDVEDFLTSDYGKAIITNSSIQILLKQSPAAIDKITEVFYLSEGEKHLLLACDVGEGLFFAGPNHVAMRVVASPDEHRLITSKPEEILQMRQQKPPTL
ncbi:ATP-binding protein [Candidatus Daviesbacteria bacterium]|nr:ATP-binding protein [Candidatus Daviesbacteria bacterium]